MALPPLSYKVQGLAKEKRPMNSKALGDESSHAHAGRAQQGDSESTDLHLADSSNAAGVVHGLTCPELHLDESYQERLEADRRERQGEIANHGSKPLVSLKWRCSFVMI